jgi:hypothetical protein
MMKCKLSLVITLMFAYGVAMAERPIIDAALAPYSDSPSWVEPRSADLLTAFSESNTVATQALDVDRLMEEDLNPDWRGLRMGIVQELSATNTAGKWQDLGDGGRLWTMAVHARGAKAVRLRVPNFDPPVGAELIVYSPKAPQFAQGPIDVTWLAQPGDLWTPTIYGETIYCEFYLPPQAKNTNYEIRIDAVLNQYRTLGGDDDLIDEVPCHLDVSCYSDWEFVAQGVGVTSFVGTDLPAGFYCSAAMLNRSNSDWTPLLMSATHCTAFAMPNSLQVTWGYESEECNGAVPDPNSLPQAPIIANLVGDVTTDWTLLGLRSINLGGVVYEGWDANTWGNNSSATSISHPDRSWKRIAFGTKTGNAGYRPDPNDPPSCMTGTAYEVSFPQGSGLTEPGSSGSPIFDDAKRVRGVLSCGTTDCNASNFNDYGRMDQAWDFLLGYLAPLGVVYVAHDYDGLEIGSETQPFNRVIEGVFAVPASSIVYVQAGAYDEQLVLEKPLTLRAINGTVTIGQ